MAVPSDLPEQSSSSLSNDGLRHDVFLSFRGLDTRLSFTHYLHDALKDANLSIFFDDEEIKPGEDLKPELTNAIKASRASIIVLSKNYANSSWCLDELALILKQRRESNQIVIPVFYHVEPTHVRKQTNTFGDAMAEHKEKMEAETNANRKIKLARKISQWKKSLKEVADLKGMDVNGRVEKEFISEIVEEIHRRLHVPLRSTLPQLFGVRDSIKFVSSWMKDDSSDKGDILAILGMGGIGKTSLAKYVYELHFRDFHTSSFIEDINRRCNEKFNGFLDIQKQLIDDISKTSSTQVFIASMYTSLIENVLASKKVFLVLDDISNLDQLDALLGSKGFYPGSKIIITTRDASLIDRCALFRMHAKSQHTEHELKSICETESRKLICFHAFMGHDPTEGYEEVLEELVKYCEGHPLALKVLSMSLCNREASYWAGYLRRVRVDEEYSPVSNVLRMSFDSLPFENDRELFKHIACFFVGMDRAFTETILKACDINTSGITNLIERCLLSIGRNNELMMHPLLHIMGRCIVRKESEKKPWKQSRLWSSEQSFRVLKHKNGTEYSVGLSLDIKMLQNEEPGVSFDFELETDALSKMENLKLLQLNYVQMNGSFGNFPTELRWLCMHGFSLKSIPSELRMEKLVALDLSYSKIESFDICYTNQPRPQKRKKLSGSCSKHKRFLRSLKILDLSFCEHLRVVGGFDELYALERLILKNCTQLHEVCESIRQCDELVLVDLSYCKTLEKLPRIINMLKNVETLLLDGCNLGKSQVEISDMDSSIVQGAIPSDRKLFAGALVSLSLENNNLSCESFPMAFSRLSMLTELYLDGNPIVSLPSYVRSLPNLEVLSMRNCNMLKSVEHPPQTLAFLDLYSNHEDKLLLQKVVFHPKMSPLELSVGWNSLAPSSFEIEGMVRIQPMAGVEEKVLCSLGWSNLDSLDERRVGTDLMLRGPEESEIQMYYEFGIFSAIYGGKKMPDWVTHRSKGRSISFIIPSSRRNLTGLNFCYVETFRFPNDGFRNMPLIRISNTTNKCTWIYEHYISKVNVRGKYLTLLSHWMFGRNEMKAGDDVTITVIEQPNQVTKECGVSFVYDDGKADEEDDVLGYYKSWNHIIRGDLTGFQLSTGQYILNTKRFFVRDPEVNLHYRPLVGDEADFKDDVWFRALSRRITGVHGGLHEQVSMQGGSSSKRRRSSTTNHRIPSVKSHRRTSQLVQTHPLLYRSRWQILLRHTRTRIQKRRVQRRCRRPSSHRGRIHN